MNEKRFTVRPQIEVNLTQQDVDDIIPDSNSTDSSQPASIRSFHV